MDATPDTPDATPAALPAWVRAADALAVAVGRCWRCWWPGSAGSACTCSAPACRSPPARASSLAGAGHPARSPRHPAGSAGLSRAPGDGSARWRAADGLRAVLPLWLASRLAVLLVGFLAVGTFGYRDGGAPFRLYKNEFLNLPARYDAGWYLGIAADGYRWDPAVAGQQNIAFMPALPMLMRFGGRLIGGQPLWAGQFLVLGACLWAFVYVYRLARSALGDADRRRGPWRCWRRTRSPSSTARSTRSRSSCSARRARSITSARRRVRAARRRSRCCAGSRGPTGSCSPCRSPSRRSGRRLVAAWRRRGQRASARGCSAPSARRLPAIAAASAAVLGVLVFSAFIYSMTGRPLAWLEAHAAWGRTFGTWVSQGPFQELGRGGLYGYTRSQPIDAVNFVAILVALAAIWPVTRRFGVPYGVVPRRQPDPAAHQPAACSRSGASPPRCSRCSSGSPRSSPPATAPPG